MYHLQDALITHSAIREHNYLIFFGFTLLSDSSITHIAGSQNSPIKYGKSRPLQTFDSRKLCSHYFAEPSYQFQYNYAVISSKIGSYPLTV